MLDRVIVTRVSAPASPASRLHAGLLAASAAGAALALGLGERLTGEPPLWAALGLAGVVVLPLLMRQGDRWATALIHLPVLAAMFLGPPSVAPLVAALLTAVAHRDGDRMVVIASAGGSALAAACASATFRLAGSLGLPTDPADPAWPFAAAIATLVLLLVGQALAGATPAMRGEPPQRVIRRWAIGPTAGPTLVGAAILIGFLSLAAGIRGTGLHVMAGGVALIAVALLAGHTRRSHVVAEARSEVEAALVDREEAVRELEEAEAGAAHALRRAERARTRLNDVAGGTVPVLVAMVDLRDRYTARHSTGVGRLCRLMAEELGWPAEDVALAHMTGLVHDVGKIGLSDDILRKPEPPTPEEWGLIRRHPDWGADALAEMRLMPDAVDGVRAHHERWDGSGYPEGLAGREIPPLARMVAVADSYDAMTGHRPFRPAKPRARARAEIAELAGALYDPEMAGALLRVLDDVDDLDEALAPRDFAAEWRRACARIDVLSLYLPASAELEAAGRVR